jgi:hypothetical protein
MVNTDAGMYSEKHPLSPCEFCCIRILNSKAKLGELDFWEAFRPF